MGKELVLERINTNAKAKKVKPNVVKEKAVKPTKKVATQDNQDERPTRRRLASKKFSCAVPKCLICAQSFVEKADDFGPAGFRCSGHNGGTRCNVVGCRNSAFRKVKDIDMHGDPGLRCVRHGGRNGMCNVAACPNVAKYHSASDHFGEIGKRCKRHCLKALCEVQGCFRLGRDSEPKKPRKCVRHGGGHRCLETGCSASALPKRGPSVPQKCSKHGGGVYCVFEGCVNLALMDFDGKENVNAKCRKHAQQTRNGGVPVNEEKVASKRTREKKTCNEKVPAKKLKNGSRETAGEAENAKENVKKVMKAKKAEKVNLTIEFPSKASDVVDESDANNPKGTQTVSVLTENRTQSTVAVEETYSF